MNASTPQGAGNTTGKVIYPATKPKKTLEVPRRPTDKVLIRKNVCLVVGHEPGGGAAGERKWNIEVSKKMKTLLESLGAKVLIYYHRTKAYTQRCNEMRSGVNRSMPNADCVVLLHYNAVTDPKAHGHEFHYGGYAALAKSFRDAFQEDYPSSRARHSNGVLHNTDKNGAQMIRKAPAACVLTEPFFISNPREKAKFGTAHQSMANTYVKGIVNFLT